MTMNEENSPRKDGYTEDDLFSNGNGQTPHPGVNTPKPLFPATENPSVKPLFESARESASVPSETPADTTIAAPQPDSQPITEAFIESKLKEAGPTTFVNPSALPSEPNREIHSFPDEAPSSYLTRAEAPEVREPIIVQGKTPREENESEIEVPAEAPAGDGSMTAQPPEDAAASFSEKKPENIQPELKQTENEKLKTARPLPSSGPRYGKIRTREAIIPPDMDRNKIAITADPATSTIGKLMQNARKQAGMSLEQASAATRIKKNYIEAVEMDDFKSLPSGIFPSAYVRTLCGVYNLNEESRNIALRKIRESAGTHEEVPKQLIQHLEQDVQKNEEEEKRINKIFYLVVSAAAMILVLIIAGIILLTVSLRQPRTITDVPDQRQAGTTSEVRTPPVNSFDAGQLESLTPPQIPSIMRELVIPSR